MKSRREVEEFRLEIEDARDVETRVSCFEACVPVEFWNFADDRITHNREAFEKYVLPYCAKWKTALEFGYGLLFLGENGVGKTVFVSRILRHAIRLGCSAYYTTAPQLDYDIRTGWQDKEARLRLEEMLQSDFVAIDELNKDRVDRAGESVARDHIERVLKQRFDDQMPTLLSTNARIEDLRAHMGESFMSIVEGKYEVVHMLPGDFRKTMSAERKIRMGFKA